MVLIKEKKPFQFMFTPSLLTQGRTDDLLWRMASCSKGRNSSRGLTRLIYNYGCSLEIDIDYVEVTCRKRRPKIHDVQLPWPVLRMKSWCKFIFENHPSLLLGGYDLASSAKWQGMFQEFWDRYRDIEGNHDIYTSGKTSESLRPLSSSTATRALLIAIDLLWFNHGSLSSASGELEKTAVSGNHGEKFQLLIFVYYIFYFPKSPPELLHLLKPFGCYPNSMPCGPGIHSVVASSTVASRPQHSVVIKLWRSSTQLGHLRCWSCMDLGLRCH